MHNLQAERASRDADLSLSQPIPTEVHPHPHSSLQKFLSITAGTDVSRHVVHLYH